jgi:hypothetical protein
MNNNKGAEKERDHDDSPDLPNNDEFLHPSSSLRRNLLPVLITASVLFSGVFCVRHECRSCDNCKGAGFPINGEEICMQTGAISYYDLRLAMATCICGCLLQQHRTEYLTEGNISLL